jgi:hypothetical protein
MAKKTKKHLTNRSTPATPSHERWAITDASRDVDDDEAQIRFSLTALGEAVVSDRDRRRPKFRGFGPCGRIVA